MKEFTLNDTHLEFFREEILKWMKEFHVKGWKIEVEWMDDCHISGYDNAYTIQKLGLGIATVKLARIIKTNTTLKKQLQKVALRESISIFLFRLDTYAFMQDYEAFDK